MRDDSRLRDRPVAVGGRTEGRGVISTCNYEARRYGIHSAMPSLTAKRLCPDLLIVPHNMDKYKQASSQMREIFYDYTEKVEPLSLDEAFLDVSECTQHSGSATLIAEEIRQRIAATVGISVSAGVAPNKFLAKIGSDWNKPNGLCVIPPHRVDEFVRELPVQKIHGVGKVTASKLNSHGISTCRDLRKLSVFELTERFGAFGGRLHQLSRGHDEREVKSSRRRKSLSVEHTFSNDLPDAGACLKNLPELLAQLQQRLKGLDRDYRIIKAFVKVKFSDFTATTLERMGTHARISDYRQLCEEAYERGNKPVRLLGVGVRFIDLQEQCAFEQLSLFDDTIMAMVSV